LADIVEVDQQPSRGTVPHGYIKLVIRNVKGISRHHVPVQFSSAAPREPYSITAALVTFNSAEFGIKID
jgi:hypothetical protein